MLYPTTNTPRPHPSAGEYMASLVGGDKAPWKSAGIMPYISIFRRKSKLHLEGRQVVAGELE
jgi:hypothetical protein